MVAHREIAHGVPSDKDQSQIKVAKIKDSQHQKASNSLDNINIDVIKQEATEDLDEFDDPDLNLAQAVLETIDKRMERGAKRNKQYRRSQKPEVVDNVKLEPEVDLRTGNGVLDLKPVPGIDLDAPPMAAGGLGERIGIDCLDTLSSEAKKERTTIDLEEHFVEATTSDIVPSTVPSASTVSLGDGDFSQKPGDQTLRVVTKRGKTLNLKPVAAHEIPPELAMNGGIKSIQVAPPQQRSLLKKNHRKQCDICRKSFRSRILLESHIKKEHKLKVKTEKTDLDFHNQDANDISVQVKTEPIDIAPDFESAESIFGM